MSSRIPPSTRAFQQTPNAAGSSRLTITDLHARGLVRAYLEQERERAREVGRRRMRDSRRHSVEPARRQ